jgi:hypothetical protein
MAASLGKRQPVEIEYDVAFHEACEHCGIVPDQLKPKPRSAFDEPGIAAEVCQKRFENHQGLLIKLLYTVVQERQRVLTAAAKGDNVEYSRKIAQKDQDERMVERAKRQREFWDVDAARLRKVRDHKVECHEHNAQASADRAKMERAAREQHLAQMAALHKANQEQLRKRYERDEKLARLRQQRVDEEVEKKAAAWQDHDKDLVDARLRRQQNLETIAGVSSADNTQARLQKAREERRRVDEDIASRTLQTLASVDQKREKHAVRQFLKQVDLANKALKERETIEERLRRSNAITEEHQKHAAVRLQEVDDRSAVALSARDISKRATIESKAKRREQAHERAKTARTSQLEAEKKVQREADAAERRRAVEREHRTRTEAQIRSETTAAQHAYQHSLLQKVNLQAVQLQQQRHHKYDRQQAAADERMKHLEEIRSMLR